MAENIESAKIICEGGLITSQNFLSLSTDAPGSANSLINFEASLSGGYRRINGFRTLTNIEGGVVDVSTGMGPVLAIAIHQNNIIAVRATNSNSLGYYRFDSTLGWMPLTTGLILSSVGVTSVRWATFNFDGIEKIMFVDGINMPVVFDGLNWSFSYGDQIIAKAKFISVWKNTIFISGDVDYPGLIAHSDPSDESSFNAASGGGQIIAGFSVTQIKPFRDALYVFGLKNIKKIELSGTNFVINDVAADIGCIASDSVVEISGDLLFLASDGIRPISATERIGDVNIASISKKVQQTVVRLIEDHSLDEVNAVVIPNKSQVRFFFSASGDADGTSEGLIGSLREANDGMMWEWGELKGIRCSCATNGFIGNRQQILHGDYDGKVFQQEVGNSFNGLAIEAMYQTPYLDFGETQRRKTMRNINIFVRPEGGLTLRTNVSYDYGGTFVVNPSGYITESDGAISAYGTNIVYGGPKVIYGQTTTPVMTNNIQGSFMSSRITFTTSEIAPSYTIQGLVFEFSVDGRN